MTKIPNLLSDTGTSLDLWGKSLQRARLQGETDYTYRQRLLLRLAEINGIIGAIPPNVEKLAPSAAFASEGSDASAESTDPAQRSSLFVFSRDDLDRMRQMFDCVHDMNPRYLEPADYELAYRIYRALHRRVPSSILNQV